MSRPVSVFKFTQLSRKEYAIVGIAEVENCNYEKLYDSKWKCHFVKVCNGIEEIELHIEDCDQTKTILERNIIGEDYCGFKLHFPCEKLLMKECWCPETFIVENLLPRIDSNSLERQFYHYLFESEDSVFGQEYREIGLSISRGWVVTKSKLKSYILGETDEVSIAPFSIKIEKLFSNFWTPIIRKKLKEVEYDYPQIYDIDDGEEAADELFNIGLKLKEPKKEIVDNIVYIKTAPKKKKKAKTYLMIDSGIGYVKIGKSVNVLKRERTLEAQNPKISLLAVCSRDIETELHREYKEYRVRGEWFNLDKEQVKTIMSNYGFKRMKYTSK